MIKKLIASISIKLNKRKNERIILKSYILILKLSFKVLNVIDNLDKFNDISKSDIDIKLLDNAKKSAQELNIALYLMKVNYNKKIQLLENTPKTELAKN